MITRLGTVFFILGSLLRVFACSATELPNVEYAILEDHVIRVVDGDTIELRGGETVRLLGIDTPETGEAFYYDAKRFLYSLVCYKTVRLEIDQQVYDMYYRLLAHVYVETEAGWVLANAEVVRAGLADLLFIPPNNRYREYYEDALGEAILGRSGMWGVIPGSLSIADLEANLVAYVTEVVSVSFVVGHVEETPKELVLRAEEGDYGFNVRIPQEIVSELEIDSLDDLVGAFATATGFLSCDMRTGPSITIDHSSQLIIDFNVSSEP
jgi:endonuclease YncB( thermonuclease family)